MLGAYERMIWAVRRIHTIVTLIAVVALISLVARIAIVVLLSKRLRNEEAVRVRPPAAAASVEGSMALVPAAMKPIHSSGVDPACHTVVSSTAEQSKGISLRSGACGGIHIRRFEGCCI